MRSTLIAHMRDSLKKLSISLGHSVHAADGGGTGRSGFGGFYKFHHPAVHHLRFLVLFGRKHVGTSVAQDDGTGRKR
jgi:hypothetical protein